MFRLKSIHRRGLARILCLSSASRVCSISGCIWTSNILSIVDHISVGMKTISSGTRSRWPSLYSQEARCARPRFVHLWSHLKGWVWGCYLIPGPKTSNKSPKASILHTPEGPSTQELMILVPNTMVFGARDPKYWVVGPSEPLGTIGVRVE